VRRVGELFSMAPGARGFLNAHRALSEQAQPQKPQLAGGIVAVEKMFIYNTRCFILVSMWIRNERGLATAARIIRTDFRAILPPPFRFKTHRYRESEAIRFTCE
jgi:hypothetical protein